MVKSPETATHARKTRFNSGFLCLVATIVAIGVISVGISIPIEKSDAMMMREEACNGCDPDSRLGSGVSSSHYGANGHATYQSHHNQPTQGGTFNP